MTKATSDVDVVTNSALQVSTILLSLLRIMNMAAGRKISLIRYQWMIESKIQLALRRRIFRRRFPKMIVKAFGKIRG